MKSRQAWGLACLLLALAAPARADVRAEEIASCRANEIVTWKDGVDRPAQLPLVVAYEGGGAPAWFSRQEIYAALEQALKGWSGCGLPTQLLPLGQVPPAGAIRVRWSDAGARGNFGLANQGDRTLSLGPAAFALLHQRNPAYPALEILQMTLSHELGHFHGLMAHSRRCVDVMSYYDDGHGGHCELREPGAFKSRVEYRSTLPTACDIARCRAVNGVR
jgi:hypothetical protein